LITITTSQPDAELYRRISVQSIEITWSDLHNALQSRFIDFIAATVLFSGGDTKAIVDEEISRNVKRSKTGSLAKRLNA
jgi:hypothetical protein